MTLFLNLSTFECHKFSKIVLQNKDKETINHNICIYRQRKRNREMLTTFLIINSSFLHWYTLTCSPYVIRLCRLHLFYHRSRKCKNIYPKDFLQGVIFLHEGSRIIIGICGWNDFLRWKNDRVFHRNETPFLRRTMTPGPFSRRYTVIKAEQNVSY